MSGGLGNGVTPLTLTPETLPLSPPEPPVPDRLPTPFPLGEILNSPTSYDRVFQVVRAAVRQALSIERPGLGLGLSNLPPQLGAYWQITGNLIVVNEGLVRTMKVNAESPLEFNSFLYVILAHEYLHSLGYLGEAEVRRATAFVTREVFGPTHPATRMAEGDLWRMFPFLRFAPAGDGRSLKVVTRFDLDSTSTYIR